MLETVRDPWGQLITFGPFYILVGPPPGRPGEGVNYSLGVDYIYIYIMGVRVQCIKIHVCTYICANTHTNLVAHEAGAAKGSQATQALVREHTSAELPWLTGLHDNQTSSDHRSFATRVHPEISRLPPPAACHPSSSGDVVAATRRK